MLRLAIPALSLSLLAACAVDPAAKSEDRYLWLEDVDGAAALAWVEEQNEKTADALASDPGFDELYEQAVSVLNDESRIPRVTLKGGSVYNLWQDETNPRGLYRRMAVADFVAGSDDWETVLDIDVLSAEEGIRWVFRGTECDGKSLTRCLVRLSPGGSDAIELREFNLAEKAFVEGGFRLSAGKHRVEWRDEDHLYLAPDLGDGWRTTSGYPNRVVILARDQPVEDAPTLFSVDEDAMSVQVSRISTSTTRFDLVNESLGFWDRRYWLIEDDGLSQVELPTTAVVRGGFEDDLVVQLYRDWGHFRAGSLVLVDPTDGNVEAALFEPEAGRVLSEVSIHDRGIILTLLDNVRGKVEMLGRTDGVWQRRTVEFPDDGAIDVTSIDPDSGEFFARFESFTTPPTLYFAGPTTMPRADAPRATAPRAGAPRAGAPRATAPRIVRQLKPAFDADEVTVTQHWTESADGTRVPYFMVAPTGIRLDGSNPVHVFSYGGFRNALTPSYSGSYENLSGAYGKLWLERGGVFVSANIRGGGEFGPEWHAAALRENRPRAFEDFEAIAEDLIKRGVTSAGRIGIEGRSNGGLLVTATMVRRPDLYGAVICGVPLADMKRYHKLLAGASWMGEYGNPDVAADWAFISGYSPYQNLSGSADYPPVLYYTSTRDDRVHPAHARKMTARMTEQGHTAWLYENTEGGHGASSTPEDLAYRLALAYTLLWRYLED